MAEDSGSERHGTPGGHKPGGQRPGGPTPELGPWHPRQGAWHAAREQRQAGICGESWLTCRNQVPPRAPQHRCPWVRPHGGLVYGTQPCWVGHPVPATLGPPSSHGGRSLRTGQARAPRERKVAKAYSQSWASLPGRSHWLAYFTDTPNPQGPDTVPRAQGPRLPRVDGRRTGQRGGHGPGSVGVAGALGCLSQTRDKRRSRLNTQPGSVRPRRQRVPPCAALGAAPKWGQHPA